jgi:hypothetical protein
LLLDQELATAAEDQNILTQQYNQLTAANLANNATQSTQINVEMARVRTKQAKSQTIISQLNSEIAKAVKCPLHQLGLHYHRNRVEDLYICENGPHFLFWTLQGGKPALIPVPTLALPGLDYPMTEGTKISRLEWLASHIPPFGTNCANHPGATLELSSDRADVFECRMGEKYLWTQTKDGPHLVPLTGELPSLEQPID